MFPFPQESTSPGLSLEQIRVCILVARDLTVLNISQNGLAVHTEKPLTMGLNYSLQLSCMNQSVSLDGEVARCNLAEISETIDGDHKPYYLNGIHFQIDRNPLELSLLDILYTNMTGEKRKGGPRVKPLKHMSLDIGRTCFTRVDAFTHEGLLLQSTELIDLDCDWKLLIQVAGRSIGVSARVLFASKKNDAETYSIQVEWVDLSKEQREFIGAVVRRLNDMKEGDIQF